MNLLKPNKMLKTNKGFGLDTSILNTLAIGLVLLVVLFKLAAALIPEAQDAGDELCASGIPLASTFKGDGVVFIIVAAALLLTVVAAFLYFKKRK